MKTLSRLQLAQLGSISRKAWNHLQAIGFKCGPYQEWRHEFTADHCAGRSSWRQLLQSDYVPLCNAFRAIYGGQQKQDHTPTQEQALIYTIKDRCQHWEAPRPYVAKIVADKTGRHWITPETSLDTMLAGLGANILRQILYTLQNRLRKLAKRDAEALGLPEAPETHTSRSTIPPARLAAARGDIDAAPRPQPRRNPAAGLPQTSTPAALK